MKKYKLKLIVVATSLLLSCSSFASVDAALTHSNAQVSDILAETINSAQKQNSAFSVNKVHESLKLYQIPGGPKVIIYPHYNRDNNQFFELRLVVRAGSIDETLGQEGLAHYVEHLAFNGTEAFPENTLVKELESNGVSLGADINAVTSLGGTVFQLSIPVKASEKGKEVAFKAMSEWSNKISFKEDAFNKERKTIIEEWRLRQGVGMRINGPLQSLRYSGTGAEYRDPIGLIEVIENVKRDTGYAFYKNFYRPENETFIVAGMHESDAIDFITKAWGVKPVKDKSQSLAIPSTPRNWGDFGLTTSKVEPGLTKERVKFIFDSEMPDRFMQIMWQEAREDFSYSEKSQKDKLIDRIIVGILKARLDSLQKSESIDFSFDSSDAPEILTPRLTQSFMIARPKNSKDWEKVVEEVSYILNTLTLGDFSEAEILRVASEVNQAIKAQTNRFYDANQEATYVSDAIVYEMPIAPLAEIRKNDSELFQKITVEDVEARAKEWGKRIVKLGLVGPNDKDSLALKTSDIIRAWNNGNQRAQKDFDKGLRFTFKKVKEYSYPFIGFDKSNIKAQKEEKLPTGEELLTGKLANGAKLVVLSSTKLRGFDTLTIASKKTAPKSKFARLDSLVRNSGFADFSARQIAQKLSDSKVNWQLISSADNEGLFVEMPPSAWSVGVQVALGLINKPEFKLEALEKILSQQKQSEIYKPAEAIFMESITKDAFEVVGKKEEKKKEVNAKELLGELRTSFEEVFSNPEDITIYAVTRADAKKIYSFLASNFNKSELTVDSVEGKSKKEPLEEDNAKVTMVPKFETEKVKTYAIGTSDKAMLQIHMKGKSEYSEEKMKAAQIITAILKEELRLSLRQDARLVYAVGLDLNFYKDPFGFFLTRINLTTKPENISVLRKKLDEFFANAQAKSLSKDSYEFGLKNYQVELDRNARDTYYISQLLMLESGKKSIQKSLEDLRSSKVPSFEVVKALFDEVAASPKTTYIMTKKN